MPDRPLPSFRPPAPSRRLAASVALFRGSSLLLVRRKASGTRLPLYSLPGGKIEEGETPLAAARRELLEETGLTCAVLKPVMVFLPHTLPYAIHVFAGISAGGVPQAGDDAAWCGFRPLAGLLHLALTEGLEEVVAKARRQLQRI